MPSLSLVLLSSLFVSIIALSGCGGGNRYYSSNTPVIKKQAKRAYNKSYKIKGKHYRPRARYEYSETGISSYYGGRDVFHGRKTSTGERFDKNGLTAAHKTLPLPSVVRVTNLKNGRSLKLRINDRGPFIKGRIIDVSEKAAKILGFHHDGITKVRVDCLVSESIHLGRHYNPKKCNPYTVHGQHTKGSSNGRHNALSLSQTLKLSAVKIKRTREKNRRKIREKRKPQSKMQRDIHLQIKPYGKSYGSLRRGTYIQIGTYSSRINANNFAYKVQSRMGTPCLSQIFDTSKGRYHRVLMGPMKSKTATKKMLNDLSVRNVKDAFVIIQE